MERAEIKTKLTAILCNSLMVEEDEVTEESNLFNDLCGDSIDNIQICMECEKEFDINIPDIDWEETEGEVSKIIDLVENMVKGE